MPNKTRNRVVRKRTLKAKCDALFSKIVRARGRCEMKGWGEVKCSSLLQCCHILRRNYHATRWDERNAISGCQAHHVFYTHWDLEWQKVIRDYIGDELYDELRGKALTYEYPDLEETFARLQARAKELNLIP